MEIKFKLIKGEPRCSCKCPAYPRLQKGDCTYGRVDDGFRALCIPGLCQQRDAAQERLNRIDTLIDRRIADYAECEADHTAAVGGALKELRHIQKMVYIINAGNKVEEPPDLTVKEKAHIYRGESLTANKIEVIQRYRARTACSLLEAKNRVEEYIESQRDN